MQRLTNRFAIVAFALVAVMALAAAVLVQNIAEAQPSEAGAGTGESQPAAVSTGSWQIEPDLARAVELVEQDQAAQLARQFEDYVTAAQLQEFAATVQAEQQRRAAAAQAPSVAGGSVWDQLAQCETGGRWSTSSVPGYSGGLGFANSSWAAYGGTQFAPTAGQASREQQIVVAERIRASAGWGAWPACSARLGLR